MTPATKKSRPVWGALCAVLLVAACSEANKEDHVWKDQVKTLERARGAEQTLLEGSKARDEQIEGETGK